MGQSCGRFITRRLYEDDVICSLSLKTQEVALLTISWLPIRGQDNFDILFLTWYVTSPRNHQLPSNLTEFSNRPSTELVNSERFRVRAKSVFRDFDRIVTALEHPQELKTVVDSITAAYIKQGLTDTDFQNLSFSLLSYLKGVRALTPLAEFSWSQLINKISLYMWDAMQKHFTPGRRMPFKMA